MPSSAEHAYHVRLRPVSTAPRAARDALAEACADWGAPGFLEAGGLVLSELVSNAVVHSGRQTGLDVGVELSLRDGSLLMRVHDGGSDLPQMAAETQGAAAAATGAGGYGLGIVSKLTESWGVDTDSHGSGKTVWCVLRERPAGLGGAAPRR